jgi:hypothetical protein
MAIDSNHTPCRVMFGIVMAVACGSGAAANPVTIFDCHLPGGKLVTVTQDGGSFTYRHGTAHSTDMKITGDANSGNVFYWSGRYTNIEEQLRFTKGDYSYIVFSLPANANLGADAVSGIEVLKGTKDISDATGNNDTCSPWADLKTGSDNGLPPDDDSWSAM